MEEGKRGEGGDRGSLTQAHGAFLDHWSVKYNEEGFPSVFTAAPLHLDAIREPWQRGFYGGRRRSGGAEFPDLQREAGKRSEVERRDPGLLLLLVRTCGTSWTVLSYQVSRPPRSNNRKELLLPNGVRARRRPPPAPVCSAWSLPRLNLI